MSNKTYWVMVDVETDGPIPGDYSMIQLGAMIINDDINKCEGFIREIKPISDNYIEEALNVSGFNREMCMCYPLADFVMLQFDQWLESECGVNSRLMFISDNNGFDWQFVNWYFLHFLKRNPFGHSSTNLGSLYKGLKASVFENFKHLRKTKHTHNALDDCRGNVESLIYMKREMGLKIKF